MKLYFRALMVLIMMLVGLQSQANITVEATIDSIQIFVGQQAHVTLKVTTAHKDKLELPPFKPNTMVLPNVELLDISTPDTSDFDGNRVIQQVYTFTSFDANLYYLPPFPVKVNGKEYKSESLALKVLTIDVDTTKLDQFFPPKDVMNNPFSWEYFWQDWRGVIIASVIAIIVAILFVYLYKRYKSNRPILKRSRIITRIPAHQKALKALEVLKNEAVQTGDDAEDSKLYYTRLTDTLRKYIEERFGFNAMEMTSTEIISRLKQENDEEKIRELRELFQTADLVKFAKHSTLFNENDMNLVSAMDFINSTKTNEIETKEVVRPEFSVDEKKTNNQRMLIRVLLYVAATAFVALLAYVVYNLYDLLA